MQLDLERQDRIRNEVLFEMFPARMGTMIRRVAPAALPVLKMAGKRVFSEVSNMVGSLVNSPSLMVPAVAVGMQAAIDFKKRKLNDGGSFINKIGMPRKLKRRRKKRMGRKRKRGRKRSGVPRGLKSLINAICPTITGYQSHVESLTSALNQVAWSDPSTCPCKNPGSVISLNEFVDYYTQVDGSGALASNFDYKYYLQKQTVNITFTNPGNSPIELDVYEYRVKTETGTGHYPHDLMNQLIASTITNPAVVASARTKLVATDVEFSPRLIEGLGKVFKQTRHAKITLQPDSQATMKQYYGPKVISGMSAMSTAAGMVKGGKFIWYRVKGALAADSGGLNIGYAPATVQVAYNIKVVLRRSIATNRVIGRLTLPSLVAPAAVTPSTFSYANAATAIVDK